MSELLNIGGSITLRTESEWVEHCEKAVEEALESMRDRIEIINGEPWMMMASDGYKIKCLQSAANNLEAELFWRDLDIKKKYCE